MQETKKSRGFLNLLYFSIFYIRLALHHRQLLDFAAKGNFIELDANTAYEILEGILGIPPTKKGISFTQEGFKF